MNFDKKTLLNFDTDCERDPTGIITRQNVFFIAGNPPKKESVGYLQAISVGYEEPKIGYKFALEMYLTMYSDLIDISNTVYRTCDDAQKALEGAIDRLSEKDLQQLVDVVFDGDPDLAAAVSPAFGKTHAVVFSVIVDRQIYPSAVADGKYIGESFDTVADLQKVLALKFRLEDIEILAQQVPVADVGAVMQVYEEADEFLGVLSAPPLETVAAGIRL